MTGLSAGTCTIAANQAGKRHDQPAPQVTQNITSGPGPQHIQFSLPAPAVVVAGTAAVSAAATSGLPVTFTSLTPGKCTVSGDIVTGVAVGTCTVAGNQPGNANYAAAPQATQTIPVGTAPVAQSITFGAAPAGIRSVPRQAVTEPSTARSPRRPGPDFRSRSRR